MTNWTKDDLQRLDLKYAQAGVLPHQRPFRAAMELLGGAFALGGGDSPSAKIMEAYATLFAESNTSLPGPGVGLVASLDRVRRVTLPVVYGSCALKSWQAMGFANRHEWWEWCRNDHDIGSQACFAFIDLHDFAYGLIQAKTESAGPLNEWRMAHSFLEDVANALSTTFGVESVLQPICIIAELALKGVLVWKGADTEFLKRRYGHNLKLLAKDVASALPHDDDLLIAEIVAKLPSCVESRYKPAGLKRLEVVQLAIGVQFIAASALRRVTSIDLASQMRASDWSARSRSFFPETRTMPEA